MTHGDAKMKGGRTPRPRAGETHLRARDFTPLAIGLAVLVLISVGRVHEYFQFLSVFRPGLTVLAACVVAALLVPRWVRLRNLTGGWAGRAMIMLVAVIALSSVTGLSMGASGAFVLTVVLPILLLYAVLVVGQRSTSDLRLIVAAYVASCVFVAMLTFFVSDSHVMGGVTRVEGVGMYDGNDMGVLYLVGLPLSVALLRSGGRIVRPLGWLGLLALPASLALTSSRGGFIGLVVGALAVLFFSHGVSVFRRVAVVGAAATAFLIAVPPGYWDQMSTILALEEDYNVTDDTGRLQIWKRGMGYVAAYPVFGVGPNNFIRAGWELSPQGRTMLVGTGLRDLAPHNTFVQVWAELGTVGLGVWMWLLLGTVVSGVRWRRRFPAWWLRSGSPDQRFMYLMACYLPPMSIGFAATSFFVTHAFTSMFYVMIAIVATFGLQAPRMLADSRTSEGARPRTAPLFPATHAGAPEMCSGQVGWGTSSGGVSRPPSPGVIPLPTRLGVESRKTEPGAAEDARRSVGAADRPGARLPST